MKHQIRNMKPILTRVVMGLLLLAMLGGVLTSCGNRGGSKITTVTKGSITLVEGETYGLTAEQLDKLAQAISESKDAATIRTRLVAALRGYDMTDAAFNDSNPGEAQPDKAPAFALKALDAAAITTTDYQGMTVADVEALVKCFQISVDTAGKLGVLDQILNYIGKGFNWLINVPGGGYFILGTVYFAIALELLMIPLGIRQQKNSLKQARLRPREMAIRNKYKGRNDQQTQQKVTREIQELYAQEGYSPMAGCLPLFITLPFLLFLYYIVIDPLTYVIGASTGVSSAFLTFADAPQAAGGLGLTLGSNRGTIEVLSLIKERNMSMEELLAGIDGFAYFTESSRTALCEALTSLKFIENIPNFKLFNLNMGLTPGFDNPILLVMPVLTFIAYWGSGKINRKFTFQPMQNTNGQKDPAQGCSNGMMNVMMPAMSAWFTFMVPAAVGLYWIFKSILGVIKQIIIAKLMPLPVFTDEDYKAAERELMGKEKSKPSKNPDAPRDPNVRSLHHIDDEDYESPAEREARLAARKRDYVEPEDETPKAKVADNAYGDGATLKEDDRPARKSKKEKKNEEKSDD